MQEGQQFGPYQLVKRIAFGGMAEIHLAKTSGIGGFEKLLALKVIHPKYSEDQEFIDMLIDEAKIAVQLSHVNICQTFDLGRVDSTYYIALEFIDGKDLYQLLVKCSEKDIAIPLDLIAFIGMEMSAGLHFAHTKSDNYGQPLNLIHRDVSPQNVLVSYDGEVKIVDFGIAKASKRSRETESGVIKGKFFYMSPEQAWGDNIDSRTDIFSSGICLYEMITGEMLYHEEKALLLLDKVRKAEIPNMRVRRRDLPQQLEQIVLRALTRDRDRRFQTAGELHAALSGFLYGNWPNFNRSRLTEFMKAVFGDNRFVLPKPVPQAKVVAHGPLMGSGDFDPTSGHSVLFDLNAGLPAVGPQAAPKAAPKAPPPVASRPATPKAAVAPPPPARPAPDASFDDPEPTSAIEGFDSIAEQTGPIGRSLFPEPDDEDAEEHTILESVWADGQPPSASSAKAAPPPSMDDGGDDDDRTAILGPDIMDQVKAAGLDLGETEGEQPTSLFSRPGEPPPKRVNRPVPTPADALDADSQTMTLEPTPVAPTPAPRTAQRPAPAPPSPPAPRAAPPRAVPAPPPPPTPIPVSEIPDLSPSAPPPPAKPRPAPSNRAAEAARPTMMAMPAPSKAGKSTSAGKRGGLLGKIATPTGVTVVVLLILLVYAAIQLVPTLLAPDKPKVTAVVVTSTPAGASVFMDGVDTGQKTPARLENVPTGSSHVLKLSVAGHDEVTESFSIPPGDPPAEGELKRRIFLAKQKGKIEINSVPDHAEVYVDGKFSCETPCALADLDRDKNEVRLLMRKDGYRDYPDVIRWGDETSIKVEYKLSPREK
jgi:serine/threonine protein kinase